MIRNNLYWGKTASLAASLMVGLGSTAYVAAQDNAAAPAPVAPAVVAAPVAAPAAPVAAPAAKPAVAPVVSAPQQTEATTPAVKAAPQVKVPSAPKAAATPQAKTAAPAAAVGAAPQQKAKAAPIPVVSKEDVDLWAFLVISNLAPGKTIADFRALPNFSGEKKDELRGTVEDNAPQEPSTGPFGYRFTYSDGMDIRVLDYGSSAFVTRLRVAGADRVLKDEVKIGGPRAPIDAALGRPVRGGGSYAVYEGQNDQIRVFYTPAGTVSAVEIEHGS